MSSLGATVPMIELSVTMLHSNLFGFRLQFRVPFRSFVRALLAGYSVYSIMTKKGSDLSYGRLSLLPEALRRNDF
jgi:hypothetical protein